MLIVRHLGTPNSDFNGVTVCVIQYYTDQWFSFSREHEKRLQLLTKHDSNRATLETIMNSCRNTLITGISLSVLERA